MALINPVIFGGSSSDWVRPADWLSIPEITTGEEVIYILMAVYNVEGNFAAFKFAGNYTVDWGDGNIENVASGVKAQHSYDWDDLDSSTLTSDGFRQALIKVTPQAGNNITLVDLQQKHTNQITWSNSEFIDIVMNAPSLGGTNLIIGYGDTVRHFNIQRVWIKQIGNLTICFKMFHNCQSLQSIPLFNTSSVTHMGHMFYNCQSLQSIPLFNTSSVTYMDYMFRYTQLREIPLLDFTNLRSVNYAFADNIKLKKINNIDYSNIVIDNAFARCPSFVEFEGNISGCTSLLYTFYESSFKSIILNNCGSLTVTTQAFISSRNLGKLILTGIKVGFSIANCQMSATALNELFTSLGTANGTQSIIITGNYGAATCNTSIATAKGWTIVN